MNFMDISQISPKILAIVIAAVFALIGRIILWLVRRWTKRWLWAIGIAYLVGALIEMFVNDKQLREILVAASAVMAVVIAVFSIEQTRRLRQDSTDKDNRDRKQKEIDEIVEWTINILSAGADINVECVPKTEGKAQEKAEINLRSDLKTLSLR